MVVCVERAKLGVRVGHSLQVDAPPHGRFSLIEYALLSTIVSYDMPLLFASIDELQSSRHRERSGTSEGKHHHNRSEERQ